MATYLDDAGKLRDENDQRVDEYGSPVEDMDDETYFRSEDEDGRIHSTTDRA